MTASACARASARVQGWPRARGHAPKPSLTMRTHRARHAPPSVRRAAFGARRAGARRMFKRGAHPRATGACGRLARIARRLRWRSVICDASTRCATGAAGGKRCGACDVRRSRSMRCVDAHGASAALAQHAMFGARLACDARLTARHAMCRVRVALEVWHAARDVCRAAYWR